MNRNILFRAKDRNGKWHYGSLVTKIVRDITDEYRDEEVELYCIKGLRHPYEEHKVIFEDTIEQDTNFTDSKHRHIFEGDIITDGNTTAYVSFNTATATFEAVKQHSRDTLSHFILIADEDKVQIIGNIHDNRPKTH